MNRRIMNLETYNKNLLLVCVIFLALVAFLFYRENANITKRILLQEEHDFKMAEALGNTPVLAKAVSVYSASRHKKIFGKNDDIAMPIASIAKIMTTVVALNAYGPDDIVTITPSAIKQAGDFTLTIGEKWKIYDLAKLTLISSANDGAFAMWENYPKGKDGFLPEMNSRAKRLGMEHTNFGNIMGLDVDGKATVFAGALDVSLLSSYALLAYPDVFQVTVLPEINLTSETGVKHNFKNTNTVVQKIPNLVFSKTGYTDIAGGNLTIVFKNSDGEYLVVTVLGSTYEGRFLDVQNLVNVLYNP